MKSSKLLLSGVLGIGITVGLFYLMYALVLTDEVKLDDLGNDKIADIVMPEPEIDVRVAELKPEQPEEPEEPPPPMQTPDVEVVDVDMALNMAAPAAAGVKIGLGGGLGASDGEYLPIVKVAPIYPRRATSRGIEGYCIVEYTVTTNGSIRDPQAVDCQPAGIFESASIKASLKFKYKPRVVDGEAIEVAGVQNKFTYTLEK
jgi:protein TonB